MTAPVTESHLPPPTPMRRNLVFGAIGTAIVLGWVGDALWGSLLDRSPLTLLLLNAKPRYQLLVVNELEPWVFYPVALARLLVTKPLVWLVGAWYGPRAVDWIASRSERSGRVIRWMQRHFPRYGWAIMIVTTSNPVCLLAGSVGYSLGWLMVWAVIGTLIRLYAVDVVGGQLSEQINWLSPSGGSAAKGPPHSTSWHRSRMRWRMQWWSADWSTTKGPWRDVEPDR